MRAPPELLAKCAEVQIDEPELFKDGPGTLFVQPDVADCLPPTAALHFAGVSLRQMPDKTLAVFGWCAKLWRSLAFPVRELCSDLQSTKWVVV